MVLYIIEVAHLISMGLHGVLLTSLARLLDQDFVDLASTESLWTEQDLRSGYHLALLISEANDLSLRQIEGICQSIDELKD